MMEEIKKHKLSLSLIALLIGIKFVIVPILNWQDEQLAEIDLLQKQMSRIDNVLDNRQEIEHYETSLSQSLAEAAELFLTTDNVDTFQLVQQQWLEEKLKKYDLKADNIGWSSAQEYAESNLVAHNVQLNINGKTIDLLAFIQELQAQTHYIAVQAFNINFKRQNKFKLGTVRTRLNLIFYRQGKLI